MLEALEAEGKWGVTPPDVNGSAAPASAPGASGSDRPQR